MRGPRAPGRARGVTSTTAPGQSAHHQMTRVAAAFVAGCVLIYLPVLAPMIVGDFPHARLWTVVTVVAEAAAAIAVLVVLSRHDRARLRAVLVGFALLHVALGVLWRPLWDGSPFAEGHWLWHTAYAALATVALTPYLRPVWVWTVHTVTIAAGQAATIGVSQTPYVSRLLSAWVIGGFAVAAAVILLTMARDRDLEEEAARERAAAAGAAEAREIERERVDGLIHDSVMSTLLAASRAADASTVAASARQAIGQLAALRHDEPRDVPLGAEALVGLVRSSVAYVAPGAEVVVDSAGAASGYPGGPMRALVAATTEASRNCSLHTPGATPRVGVVLGPDRVDVTVADDGPGFDPDRVPANRLGIRTSILGRMHALDGGSARVDSAPGAGTRVTLGWRA